MKGTVAIAVALACASLAAEPAAETWEATVGVSPEAVATGVDGVFMETHFNPPEALSDAANAIAFSALEELLTKLVKIHEVVHS